MTVPLICDGPGPHIPADGILGTASKPVSGMRCTSPACAPTASQQQINRETLEAKARQAIESNKTFLGHAAIPGGTLTAAQLTQAVNLIVPQLDSVAKQLNALIKITLGQLDDTAGT